MGRGTGRKKFEDRALENYLKVNPSQNSVTSCQKHKQVLLMREEDSKLDLSES
jgi:hypothetical protein